MKRACSQAFVLTLAGLCGVAASATGATSTPPATVTVSVAPATPLHPKQHFSITVTATFSKRQLKGPKAFLLAFIQYSNKDCERDVNRELSRTLDTQGAYFHQTFSKSPHASARSFVAGGAGNRRVCVYLFGKRVTPGTTLAPIAHAHGTYEVVK